MAGDDPYANIAQELAIADPSTGSPEILDWEYEGPVGSDAPPLRLSHYKYGQASAHWPYRDAAGLLLGYVVRFDSPAGKMVLPLSLMRRPGRREWRFKAFPQPRPLYGLDRLALRPLAPVLVVEGEKTADKASELFPEHVVVSWPGGSKATGRVDWGPLRGRQIVVFPDADEAGRTAAQEVAKCSRHAGAASCSVVQLPSDLPPGWDLADPFLAHFSLPNAISLIRAARPVERVATAVDWPWGYRMEEEGLFFDQPVKDGASVPVRLSAPFDVLAEARERGGLGWSVVLRFKDRDRREKIIPISRSRLAAGGGEVRAELADAGLIVSPARGKADKFTVALAEVRCSRRMTLVAATGWAGDRYVLPGNTVGSDDEEPVLFTGEAGSLHYGMRGSLEGWQRGVAKLANANTLLSFALSLAFVGPLLRLLELEGGGVHFRGSSSCGKTTLAHAAGSVWGGGGPLGFGQTWRSTANALEQVAYGHNDGLVVLDELALVAPEEAGAAAYSLASGQSKARSRADGSLRRRTEWRVAILSTGEISLADHIRASRKAERPMAGQELRLLDIGADAGRRMGIWEELHGAVGPAELSDAVKLATTKDYGHAGPAFVDHLVRNQVIAIAQAKAILTEFVKASNEVGDSGQAQRAALRFGAIAAAGEMACAFGVVPWQPGQAAAAAMVLYKRWATSFGRSAPREEIDILQRLRGVIQSERSAFSPIGDNETDDETMPAPGGRDGEARGLKTYGFRHVRGRDVHYCFHSEGWERALRGFNVVDAARVIDHAGFLERGGEQGRLTKKTKVRGEQFNLYWVRASLLEADFA